MERPWTMSKPSQAGFSLMELLVVLAIMGLLAIITVPQVIKYLDGAKLTTARSAIDGFSTSLDLYRIDVGRYPTSEEGLEALIARPENVEGWDGPYIKKKASLTDPWGNPYQYRFPGEHGPFDIFSYGPDEGNADKTPKITSW